MNYFNEIKKLIEKNEITQRKYDYYKNTTLVETYFNIGKLLVEAQGGMDRASYGNKLIKNWSIELTKLYGKGYDSSNLKRFRQFYIAFEKGGPLAHLLNWTIICKLLPIKDENKRNYYINLCIKQNLSKRKLEELIKNETYERLSYKEKENITIITKEENLTINDMIKNPIYIEVDEKIGKLSEKLLQELLLEKIEKTLLELGYGFNFTGREVNLGGSYCDMLFFNTELNAYVVLELKIRKLQKQDIGQTEYYMNYIDKNIKKSFHNKTIGIILCKYDNKIVMEYCSNPNIYETTYKLINKKLNV